MGVNHSNLLTGAADLRSFPYPYITVLETPVQYKNQKKSIDKSGSRVLRFYLL